MGVGDLPTFSRTLRRLGAQDSGVSRLAKLLFLFRQLPPHCLQNEGFPPCVRCLLSPASLVPYNSLP